MNDNDGLLMRTPSYHSLESPLHYVLRLSEENGYETPAVILQIMAKGSDWRITEGWDCAHLNAVLPESRYVPESFAYRWPGSDHKCDLSLLSKFVLCKHLDARHAGVCPDCVNDRGYIPAWWALKYAIACPVHKRMLLHYCPNCGKRLSYRRRGLLTCSCGTSLVVESAEGPSTQVVALMSLLQRKVETEELPAKGNTARALKPDDLSLNTLCGVIDTVGRITRIMSGLPCTSSRSGNAADWLPNVAGFLYDWPNGVYPFCAQWYKYVNSKGKRHRSFRSVFDWAYRGILDRRAEHQTDTLFVIDAILQCAAKIQDGSPAYVRAKRLKPFAPEGAPYCGLPEASKLSGVPLHTLVRLARAKKIPCRIIRHFDRSRYEVKTEFAQQLRLEYCDAIAFRKAPKYLGITAGLYYDLRHAGVLKKIHKTVHPRGIALCDLQDFKEKTLACAKITAHVEGLQSLDQLRRHTCPRAAVVRIIKGVLDGSIACFRVKADIQRLDQLYVPIADIVAIIIKHTARVHSGTKHLHDCYGLSWADIHVLNAHTAESAT